MRQDLTHTFESVDSAFSNLAMRFLDVGAPGLPLGTLVDPAYRMRRTTDHTSPDRDQPMLETSVLFTITNPRNRLVYSKSIDIFNLVGLWFYMLRGSKDLQDIAFYNPMARKFVDEEVNPKVLRANWGERIFESGALQAIITLLATHPTTRRAYLPVLRVDDIGEASRNLPCLAGMQFLMVKGKLDMFTTMRSQSAVGVLPYDLFLLTMLHEYVSMRTGLELGSYHHYAPAFGVREFELKTIAEVISMGHYDGTVKGRPEMPKMPILEPGMKSLLLANEQRIRTTPPDAITETDLLPNYWRSLLEITKARNCIKRNSYAETWMMHLNSATDAFPEVFINKCIDRVMANADKRT